ncbi:MAG: hypothetical protein A3K06_03035, partial [Candidatus Doudnabacteria bacterium RIFCSPHIGHO2_01_52_17]
FIGTEHLLYGIVSEISSFASEVLLKNRISPESIRLELIHRSYQSDGSPWRPQLSENLRLVLEKSAIIASRHQYQFIGTEHFLFGIVDEGPNQAKKILQRLSIDPQEIRKNLVSIFENVSKFPEVERPHELHKHLAAPEDVPTPAQPTAPALEYFTVDLTEKARAGEIDPLIGRQKEVERVISILNRRTKNNPVLIGEPGVGKTAIVEGLALAIRDRKVPDTLLDKRILALDLALIVAGSMFRGEFENRLKQIIDEVKAARDIILFIDELHTVVGAGATTGSLDAANILKPALARGELRAIGATTIQEYKKHIESDAALERRFQPVFIKEPDPRETMEILRGLRPFYEAHHGVKITDEAMDAAVKLSVRYVTDRYLPDKAIDLLDETSAYHKTIHSAKGKPKVSINTIERDLTEVGEQKRQAVDTGDFAAAKRLRTAEDDLQKKKQKMLKTKISEKTPALKITGSHIAETVARMTGIPMKNLLKAETQKLLNLEERLKKKFISQLHVVKDIAASIRRSRAGITAPQRPLGSFMFLGPSGVGKTLLAKLLAEELFEDPGALIRIDMSELMERHNVARLIGAPAGYIGYEEGGRLTEAVKRRPYAVVLFDELEKAHPDVTNILLQILEEGELTDAGGKKVNFRNTLIIMTSNVGLPSLNRWAESYGFATAGSAEAPDSEVIKQGVMKQVREHFRPEFLNRIDKIVVFQPLTREDVKKIVKLEMQTFQNRLWTERKLKLTLDEPTINFIAEKSFDPAHGARLVRKNLQDLVEDPIAGLILSAKTKEGTNLKAKIKTANGERRLVIA